MTREHKLALIIGFSLVLVLGVLISDHFSKARSQQLATDMSPGTAERFGADTRGLRVVPASSQEPVVASGPGASQSTPPIELPPSDTTPLGTPVKTEIVMGRPPGVAGEDGQDNGLLHRLGNESVPLVSPHKTPIEPGGQRDGVRPIDPQTGLHQPEGFDRVPKQGPLGGEPTPPPHSSALAPRNDLVNGVPREQMTRHDVREGESVFRIAQEAYGDGKLWPKLLEYNQGKMSSNGAVREGVTLLLPPKDVLLGKSARSTEAAADGTPHGGVQEARVEPKSLPRSESKPESGGRTYVVQKGDTLSEISQKQLGTSRRWQELVELNKSTLPDADALVVGMTLKLPAK